MVKGCRIDTGQYKKALSKKDPPKILGTRVNSKTGTWQDGHRARQSLIGLSVDCANSYIPHVQHIIRICCRM